MKKSNSAILVYARLGSKRLPRKALRTLGSYTLLELVLLRVKLVMDLMPVDIYLATTWNNDDDELCELAHKLGVNIFRGDENNVVKRTLGFIEKFEYSNISRVNGDCPFVDPSLIAKGIELTNQGFDFVTNIYKRSFPYGISVECFSTELYIRKAALVEDKEEEHVTAHLYRLIDEINYFSIQCLVNLSHISLTVDTAIDLERIDSFLSKFSKQEQLLIDFYKIAKNGNTF